MIFAATNGVTVSAAPTIIDTKPLLDFELVSTAGSVGINIVPVTSAQTYQALGLKQQNTKVVDYLLGTLGANGQAGELEDILITLANSEDPGPISDFLDTINPDVFGSPLGDGSSGAAPHLGSQFSCGGANDRAASALIEETCNWSKVVGCNLTLDPTLENTGSEEDGVGFYAGTQRKVPDSWRVGLSGGYETAEATVGRRAATETQRFLLGLSTKYVPGNRYMMKTAFSLGHADQEMTRTMASPTGGGSLTGLTESSTTTAAIKSRHQMTFERGAAYLRPMVDLDLEHFHRSSFEETGLGAFNIESDAMSEFLYAATPALEVGYWHQGTSRRASGYLRVGVQLNGNTEFSATRFQGAAQTAEAYGVTTEFDQTVGVLEAGFEIPLGKTLDLRFGYGARFGETSEYQSASGKLRYNF
nr:autotransporter outer membrane beta-barrel domain-containing protein [Parvularcula maris]